MLFSEVKLQVVSGVCLPGDRRRDSSGVLQTSVRVYPGSLVGIRDHIVSLVGVFIVYRRSFVG